MSEAVLLLCQLCFKLGPKLQKQISIEVKGFYSGTKRFSSPVESVFNQLCLGSSLSPALDCFLSAPRVFKALSKCLGIGRVELQFSAISEQNNTSSGTAVFYLCSCSVYSLLSNSKSPRTVQSSNPRELFLKFTFIKCVFDSNLGIFNTRHFEKFPFYVHVYVQYIIIVEGDVPQRRAQLPWQSLRLEFKSNPMR